MSPFLCAQVLETLASQGFRRITIQLGRGRDDLAKAHSLISDGKLTVDYFRFSDTLSVEMDKADLIISHAGE